jgi:hypothetical protein
MAVISLNDTLSPEAMEGTLRVACEGMQPILDGLIERLGLSNVQGAKVTATLDASYDTDENKMNSVVTYGINYDGVIRQGDLFAEVHQIMLNEAFTHLMNNYNRK